MFSFLHRIGSAFYARRVVSWFIECFGKFQLVSEKRERAFRFFKEAVELVQSASMSEEECLEMVKRVYAKPTGEMYQEVGGVYTTLVIFCESNGLSLSRCGEIELKRIKGKIPLIREKQKTKLHPETYHDVNTNPPPKYPKPDLRNIKVPPRSSSGYNPLDPRDPRRVKPPPLKP